MIGWSRLPGRWVEEALCGQVDPELFFPDASESGAVAKALCRSCPVQQQCLEYALSTPEHFGVWGGLSTHERKNIRTQRRQEAS